MTDSLRDRIAAVLTEHQRHTAQHCLCGWGDLGHSHPEHVADAVIAALPTESATLPTGRTMMNDDWENDDE